MLATTHLDGTLTPTVVFIDNPFGQPMFPPLPVSIGKRLCDTKPEFELDSPLMLRVNGEWLLRADWGGPILPADRIEWHVPVPSGQTSKMILTLVAFIVIAYFTAGLGAYGYSAAEIGALNVGLDLAATALINALVPAQSADTAGGNNAASVGSVYNVQASGNQARINAAIPVVYGRMLVAPDFAHSPYAEYQNNDQFYYALFCLGQGHYNIEALQIDDTPFSNFQDVWYNILQPGEKPIRVLPNVVTSIEVAGNDLNNKDGTTPYVGFFVASGPQSKCYKIGTDIIFDQGLASIDDSGNPHQCPVSWRVEYQYVDDFGAPLSGIYALADEVFGGDGTATPQRVTRSYDIFPGRVQVRITRLSPFNTSERVLNSMSWGAMRGYVQYDPVHVLSDSATHLELRMKASQQLSNLSQRRITAIIRRKLRSWNPTDGWLPEAETRSIAWALADVWSNSDYGDALPDSRIDLQTLYELDQVWIARQDRFDIIFDSQQTAWDTVKTIAQTGRSTPFRRFGIVTLARDQYQDIPITAFTSRNIRPNTVSIGYSTANEDTADGVVLEYFDNRIWDWVDINCNAPNIPNPQNAVVVRIAGITGATQARREGLYMAAVNVYRRKFPSWQTEMLGLLPCYGDTVLFAPSLSLYASTGDIVDYDSEALIVTTSEPLDFTDSSGYDIRVQRPDGSLTAPITVTVTDSPYRVQLVDPLDFNVNTTNPSFERPKYIFGKTSVITNAVKVIGITKLEKDDAGLQYITFSAVAEDIRVHQADNAFLPVGGIEQDPVSGGGTLVGLYISKLNAHTFTAYGTDIPGDPRPTFTIALHNDGTFTWSVYDKNADMTSSGSFFEEWQVGTITPDVAATFMVQLSRVHTTTLAKVSGPAFETQVSLATDQIWVFNDVGIEGLGASDTYLLEIFYGVLQQASAQITMILPLTSTDPWPTFGDGDGDGDDDGDDGGGDGGGDGGDGG